MPEEGDPKAAIDAALLKWQQGDCAVDPQRFVHRFHPGKALTAESAGVDDGTTDLVEAEYAGFVVLSQTCDIVRSCKDRPLVNVCPLVEPEQGMEEVAKGKRPRFLFVPGVAGLNLVGDLDRQMSVEKALVSTWKQTRGCRTDDEVRRLALAVGRKYSRFPFPDDFVSLCRDLEKRIKEKHGKKSPEGEALQALEEIRVQAAPAWDAANVKVTFLFIRDAEVKPPKDLAWDQLLDKWLALVPENERFTRIGFLTTLEDLRARDYVDSDPLDLDHLSGP